MGKAKPTPKARKDDNPFKLKGGGRKLRLNKKGRVHSFSQVKEGRVILQECKTKPHAPNIEALNQTFRATRASLSSTAPKPQQSQQDTPSTTTTTSSPQDKRVVQNASTVEESINTTIDCFAHL